MALAPAPALVRAFAPAPVLAPAPAAVLASALALGEGVLIKWWL